MKKEKLINENRQMMWSKVNGWLDEYKDTKKKTKFKGEK